MKKKILLLIITLLFTFTLTGCFKTKIELKDQNPTITDINKIGRNISELDLSFDEESFIKAQEKSMEVLKNLESYQRILETRNIVINKVDELLRKRYIAQGLYHYDQTKNEYKDISDNLYDIYLNFSNYNKEYVNLLADYNDLYEEDFFSGYTNEEIDKLLEMNEKATSQEFIDLMDEKNNITEKANLIRGSYKDNEDLIFEYLLDFIEINKDVAKTLGFNNYVEYMDYAYARTYSLDDSKIFEDNCKKYLKDIYKSINSKSYTLTKAEESFYEELSKSSIYDEDYHTIDLAKDYARAMGGSYYIDYSRFMRNENYILAAGDYAYAGAYQANYKGGYVFLGLGCQDVSSLIHEFGHHYGSVEGYYTTDKSLDLLEFFSQGNEALFRIYLENNYPEYQNVFNQYTIDFIEYCINAIVVGSAMREFEEKIYIDDVKFNNIAELKEFWYDIASEYGIKQDYWLYEIYYDMYMISYSTSAIGSLSLLEEASNSFSSGKKKYMMIAENDSYKDDIKELFTLANLANPFEEETFVLIKDYVTKKMEEINNEV